MGRTKKNRDIFRERLTILMVFFFCILISSSEYIIEDSQTEVTQEQQGDKGADSAENETFLSVAVDAVVPFIFATVDHAFHLIYEIAGFEEVAYIQGVVVLKYPSHFFEILLERIISTNAP